MVLGLLNPLPLQGLTDEWDTIQGVQFHLEIYDRDSGGTVNGGFVGEVVFILHLQIGEETHLNTFSFNGDTR